jgi:outer membrane lipoprotein carrier protein
MNTTLILFCFGFMPWFAAGSETKVAIDGNATKIQIVTQLTKTPGSKSKTKRRKQTSRTSNRLTQIPKKKSLPVKIIGSTSNSSNAIFKDAPLSKADTKVGQEKSEIDVVIDGIQAFYKSATDLKAEFQQTYTYVQMGRKQKKSGRVFFKTPNRMRWDYKKPVAQVFVSDGQTLWVYQPREAQVFKQNLNTSQLPVALTFMSGKGELRSEFNAQLKSQDGEHYSVELIPKVNEGSYRSVILMVKKTDFSVVASTVVDPVGNFNRVTFTQVKRNTNIPERAFKFKVPDGVRVIDPPR